MEDKFDALGEKIVLGNLYGYSVDSSGVTTSTIGFATKLTKTGVTLKVTRSLRELWNDKPKVVEYNKTSVTVKAMKLFPVAIIF